MLKETPRSATLCFWFYPDIQISHNNGFPGYYQEIIFRGNPSSGGLSAILKYEYTKEEIVDLLVEMIYENLSTINMVDNLDDLEQIIDLRLKTNAMGWVNLAKYAIWLCELGKTDKALKYFNLSLDISNDQHPAYLTICKFQERLIKADKNGLSALMKEYKKRTIDSMTEAGLLKNLPS